MDDDYFGNEPSSDNASEQSEDGEKESRKTFLVNKDICPDMKPGDEMVVTIDRVLEDEYEISYAPKKEGEDDKPSEPSMDYESSVDSMFA